MTDHPANGELAREDRDKLRHWLSGALTDSQRRALIAGFWGKDCAEQARGHGIQIDACTKILATLRTPEQPANTDHTDAALADELERAFRSATNNGTLHIGHWPNGHPTFIATPEDRCYGHKEAQRDGVIVADFTFQGQRFAALFALLVKKLPAILAALRTPAPVNAEQPEGVKPKWAYSSAIPHFANDDTDIPEGYTIMVHASSPVLPDAEAAYRWAEGVIPAAKPKEMELLRWFSKHADGLKSDVAAGHRARGAAASEWMCEDDRDFRRELDEVLAAIDATLTNGDG